MTKKRIRFSIQTLIWALVLIAILIAGIVAFLPNPVDVETSKVAEGPLRVSVREDGKTRIREKYIVSSPVAGRLTRIELRPGDAITSEETLLAIIMPNDPDILDARSQAQAEARVQSATAAVNRAKANSQRAGIDLGLANSKFERAQKVYAKNGISHDEYDTFRAEYLASVQADKSAKFDLEISQFELEMAKAAVNQFMESSPGHSEPFLIYSPIAGKVLRVFQESSTAVERGTPLLELGDPRDLEIEVDVLSTDAVRIRPGADLTIEHWGGESPLKANVRVIEPAAFTKVSSLGVEEQRVNIISDFDETPDRLASLGDGYRIEARITISQLDNALQIPNSSLFRHQRQWHVFTIVDDKAVMRAVDIGLQNETHTEVLQGLQRDEEVIVYPNDQISNGVKIRRLN